MTLTLFDDCGVSAELIVELGIMTPSSYGAIWAVSLWDTGRWGTGPERVDVSAYVRSVSINRSFDAQMRQWSAGSASVDLNNLDGRFSPDNLLPGAPYAISGITGIRPACPVWISIRIGGITYPIFTGSVTDWNEDWPSHHVVPSSCVTDPENLDRFGDAVMTMVCTDAWGVLGRQRKRIAIAPVGAGDSFDTRMNRVLLSAGVSGVTVMGSSVTTYQETDLSSAVLEELNKVVESEGGAVWVDADGSFHAGGRYDLIENSRSNTVAIAFGDNAAAGEVLWNGIGIAPVSDRKIVNHAVYCRTGGVPQEYTDTASVSLYGVCDSDEQPTDLLNETDAQVVSLAVWSVISGAAPETAVNYVELKPRCDLATLGPLALDANVRDLVSVRVRPPSNQRHYLFRECFVAGIHHEISENDWTVRFSLSSATAIRRFGSSRWDLGRWGASDVDPTGAMWFT